MLLSNDQKISVCSECGGKNILSDPKSGEIICGDCGLVISDLKITHGPEWRSFNFVEENSRSRVGLPSCYYIYDKGLSTVINPNEKDASGKKLTYDTRYKMYRLKKQQVLTNLQYSNNRNLAEALGEINRLCSRLNVPKTTQSEAALIYRKALNKGICRGRSISNIAAASLYAAFRITNTPHTLNDISRYSFADKKEISQYYRILINKLEIRMPVPKAQLMVSKIASNTNLGEESSRLAVDILDEADRLKLSSGKIPMGMAAAALYLACQITEECVTQKILSTVSGVTEVTIRNRYKEMKEKLCDNDHGHPWPRAQ